MLKLENVNKKIESMIFFLNTNLNDNKKVFIALTKIYGLGKHQSLQICDEIGISREKKLVS